MGKYICILIVALSINLGEVSAHIVYRIVRDFGNVNVRINTYSEDNEDINKVMIFGQLAEKLSKELNYSKSIIFDFESHQYADNCLPEFLISYGKINYKYIDWKIVKADKKFKKDAIVIRHTASKFQIQSALKLLEYAILNYNNIKTKQKYIAYNRKYCYEYKVKSINSIIIKEILDIPNSDMLNYILTTEIYIESSKQQDISYYWSNNRYYIFWGKYNSTDTVLLNVENIYGLKRFEDASVVIFDSDSSFYYINYPQISKRQVIENPLRYYSTFGASNIDNEKLLIYFSYYRYFEEKEGDKLRRSGTKLYIRRWTYLKEKDELIQDWEEKGWDEI